MLQLDGAPDAIVEPFVRQRRRFASVLGSLTDEQWRAPSRCAEWTVQDVVAHLSGTNPYWVLSLSAGLGGSPTRFLGSFDPKATPASMVAALRGQPPAETLAAYVETTDALLDLVASVTDWTVPCESPPGHVTASAMLHHALWDAWIHERDVLLPLARSQAHEDDEIAATLRYAAGLGPMFAVMHGVAPTAGGALVVDATAPSVHVCVTVADDTVHVGDGPAPPDALVLTGDAASLADALSIRGPLGVDVPAEHAWLLSGLAEVFEEAI